MEYKIRIDFTESKDNSGELEGVIYVIGFTYFAIEGDTIISRVQKEINVPKPDPNNFVPINNVTLEMLESWTMSIINVEQLKRKLEWQITNG